MGPKKKRTEALRASRSHPENYTKKLPARPKTIKVVKRDVVLDKDAPILEYRKTGTRFDFTIKSGPKGAVIDVEVSRRHPCKHEKCIYPAAAEEHVAALQALELDVLPEEEGAHVVQIKLWTDAEKVRTHCRAPPAWPSNHP